ncbi:hypothetical protein [Patiriisocius hiemis]|uniref:Uncharacterized protein n=1 Tax=Patiriisocius hiemis TaxID=3075604 RepID=A0ABU2YEA5_9FLAO|nr:hypothetical protein [Constantimarinum sp. W242]MDT0556347.1 hypothetical protein [Constantimarinum sp. W242]
MEVLEQIRRIIDGNLIYCLPFTIISLMLIELFFNNKFKTKIVLNWIRWIIISYTAIILISFIVGMLINPQEYAIVNRATGDYKWAYWVMSFCTLILPLSLLNNKLAKRGLYVLAISILMKIGFYLERFTIVTTSFHRDYNTSQGFDFKIIFNGIVIPLIQGVIIAFVFLFFAQVYKREPKKVNY